MIYEVVFTVKVSARIEAATPQEAHNNLNKALWSIAPEGSVAEIDIDTRNEEVTEYQP